MVSVNEADQGPPAATPTVQITTNPHNLLIILPCCTICANISPMSHSLTRSFLFQCLCPRFLRNSRSISFLSPLPRTPKPESRRKTRNPKRNAHLNPFYLHHLALFVHLPCALLRLFALSCAQLHFKLMNSPHHTVSLNLKHSCRLYPDQEASRGLNHPLIRSTQYI
jgi:hypothetical protein